MSRILRTFVCLLLICCILVNFSPLKAHALDPVTVGYCAISAVVGVACIMQALGYMAASNSEPFTNTVNHCVDYLTESTSFVTNGMLTFAGYRSGQLSSMYAMRDLVQEVWQWLFSSSNSISLSSEYSGYYFQSQSCSSISQALIMAAHCPQAFSGYTSDGKQFIIVTSNSGWVTYDGSTLKINGSGTSHSKYVEGDDHWSSLSSVYEIYTYSNMTKLATSPLVNSTADVQLGNIQSPYQTVGTDEEIIEIEIAPVYIDLTKEVQEFPDPNNPSDDPDLDKKIPWLPIRIPSKNYDDTVINQTQQESWTGESEVEFDFDYGDSSGDGSGNTGTDSGSTGNTGSSWKPPSDHSQFALADLSKFFPFCIPFDLFDFFKLLNADPVAPSFTWEIQDLSGQTYGLTVDLSQWDSVAQLFRRLQLFLFVCGLAAASRKYIKW